MDGEHEPDGTVPFRIELRVCAALAGSKTAVQYGETGAVYVSPAMFSLLKHATPDELETLLKSIPLLTLPASAKPPSTYDCVPLATQQYDWDAQ